jgi:hypothetical protein
VGDVYFDDLMINRQRLLWAIATRQQLDRWEPFVADAVRGDFERPRRQLHATEIWQAEIEHHFALVAARNLFHALDLPSASTVSVDSTLRSELIEGRDLHEHWTENLPVFNVRPRRHEPKYPSGKQFAERNPDAGPYDWLAWSNKTGALLLPNVSAPALHQLLDAVVAEVIAKDDALSRFVPPRVPSPWHHENGEWWPQAVSS